MSPTQRRLDPDQVRRYVAASLGRTARVTGSGPLIRDGFAAVWWVTGGCRCRPPGSGTWWTGTRPVLDVVRSPALLHLDGWAGNVLAVDGPDGTHRLGGLVDGERYLWGDPLMDLVSPLLFRRVEDEPDERSCGRTGGSCHSRWTTRSAAGPWRVARLAELLDQELSDLDKP